MTEKQYGGSTGRGAGEKSLKVKAQNPIPSKKIKIPKIEKSPEIKKSGLTDKEKILKAGKIASEAVEYSKTIIKKGLSLLEIAEKIEAKIVELGGKPTFPVNLSINEIAAHYTPSYDDKKIAHGLLKIDLGVHIDGWIADTAFSLDLENDSENKKLIQASEKALENAIKISTPDTPLNKIGEEIQKAIESYGFSPIVNLCGHSMEQYTLHSGITIPNFDNQKTLPLGKGLRAIEPFATNGVGKIKDSKPSEIYMLTEDRTPRSPIAREVLEFIAEEYQTLPFCSRWLVKKIGLKAIIGLKQLEENGNLHRFAQLIEDSGAKVSQAEHTLFVEKDKVTVITK
ncbi:MAG: type II methionyl aminopeptidase [archaeon]